MRIALIGLGHVAQYQIGALGQLQNVVISDAFDINKASATLLPTHARFHQSLDAVLTDSSAEVFMVSTPAQTHFEVVSQLLRARKSVVVEKPACLNNAELEILSTLADNHSTFLHVAFHAAFALDLLWWIEHRNEIGASFGELIGFDAGFFDPYLVGGEPTLGALNLSGAWFDSGINALSVLGTILDPEALKLEWARMTAVPQIQSSQIQGSALFSFPTTRHRGRGFIDTNWTLGIVIAHPLRHFDSGWPRGIPESARM